MDIIDLIKTRRSIRKYKKKTVAKKLIQQVVCSGICAPSSLNRQPWRFVVVTNEQKRKFFSKEAKKALLDFLETDAAKVKYGGPAIARFAERAKSKDDTIFYNAPVIIFAIQTIDVGNTFDYGLAVENMMLCAHGLNLGTCPIGLAGPLNNAEKARKALKLKSEEKIIIGLCLGYPDEEPPAKERNFAVVDWME